MDLGLDVYLNLLDKVAGRQQLQKKLLMLNFCVNGLAVRVNYVLEQVSIKFINCLWGLIIC
jgi:hypothetical protein